MTMWWKTKDGRDSFYELAGLYLLYAFILSIAANPFIMLAVGLDKFSYVTVESTISGRDPYLTEMTSQQIEYLNKYKLASESDLQHLEDFKVRIEHVTLIALLGWCVTSPRFERGWGKLMVKFRNN